MEKASMFPPTSESHLDLQHTVLIITILPHNLIYIRSHYHNSHYHTAYVSSTTKMMQHHYHYSIMVHSQHIVSQKNQNTK